MTGKENKPDDVFEDICCFESLADSYRDYLRQKKRVREKSYPWIVRKALKYKRRFFTAKVAVPAPWRHIEGDLALDKHNAEERKPLYIREERIAVYTSLFGAYDILREPMLHPENIDYYVLTDQMIPEESAWRPIDISVIPESCHGDPVLCNRWCKMHPHLLFKDYQYSVYIDSNIWVFSDLTPLTARLDTFPVAMFRHKNRDCVYDEIRRCIKRKKGTRSSLRSHRKLVRSHGVPKGWGLLEASVIARKHSDPECVSLMDAWWDAFTKNSRRDQISLIDCLWLKGIEPSVVGVLGDNLQKCDMFFQMYHKDSPKAVEDPADLKELLDFIGA